MRRIEGELRKLQVAPPFEVARRSSDGPVTEAWLVSSAQTLSRLEPPCSWMIHAGPAPPAGSAPRGGSGAGPAPGSGLVSSRRTGAADASSALSPHPVISETARIPISTPYSILLGVINPPMNSAGRDAG